MASSRTSFLLLGLVIAVLLLSFEISAREVAETTPQTKDSVEKANYGDQVQGHEHGHDHGHGGHGGHGHGHGHGHDGKLGVGAAETQTKN